MSHIANNLSRSRPSSQELVQAIEEAGHDKVEAENFLSGTEEEVRPSKERSDELATPSQVTKTAHIPTSVHPPPLPSVTNVIILTHHSNPFCDSLCSSQEAVFQKDEKYKMKGVNGVPFFFLGNYNFSGAQPVEVFEEVLGELIEGK